MIDVLVAGGGPVGLATAICCARAGLSVTVAEPRAAPIDKACGEGVMPAALRRLAALGVDPDGHPLRGIRYLDASHHADALFRHGSGRGVRRTTLHAALADRAAALGIPVLPVRVTSFTQHSGFVSAGGVEARYLVAADGLHSPIRRMLEESWADGPPAAGSPESESSRAAARRAESSRANGGRRTGHGSRPAPPRYGLRQHFRLAPWTDLVEVYWTPQAEAYVTPVASDLVGIGLLFSRPVRLRPAAGVPAVAASRAAGSPLMGLHVASSGGAGSPAAGPRVTGSTVTSSPDPGSADTGSPATGSPVTDSPVVDDPATASAIGSGASGEFGARLAAFPALVDRLGGAAAASDVRGAGPMRQDVRRRVYGRVLLVGDASGYVDALTGEGIGVGLAQAEALAGCLAAGQPGDYERAWRRVSGPAWRFTAGLLWSRNQPLLADRLVAAAQHFPWLFGTLVNHAAEA
jgi:flavin-dependent dehydrogenase